MIEFLATVGGASLGVIIFFSGIVIYCEIKGIIERIKINYRIKHRFDKPPTAKCYCIDCEFYNRTTLKCVRFFEISERLVADNWFCCQAEPRKKVK